MKPILKYLRGYFYEVNKWVLALVSVFTALAIYINYHYLLDDKISDHNSFWYSLGGRWVVFLLTFGVPYLIYLLVQGRKYFRQRGFIVLLFLAPLIFSLKIAIDFPFHFSDDYATNNYWMHVVYWPLLCVVIATLIIIYWRIADPEEPLYGVTTKNLSWRPYGIMLLIMVPLIALAATQPDFQAAYPKLKSITDYPAEGYPFWQKLLFELSYGTDFITIELFFRGFVVIAMIKWVGKDAILAMACFYCSIHFGKPLGECISSYFGGIILGVVVYNTRSIFGGLLVHLGIAWMMEIAGYLAH